MKQFVSFIKSHLLHSTVHSLAIYGSFNHITGGGGGVQDIKKCMGICNDRDKSCIGDTQRIWSTYSGGSGFRPTQGIQGTNAYRYNTFIMNFMEKKNYLSR